MNSAQLFSPHLGHDCSSISIFLYYNSLYYLEDTIIIMKIIRKLEAGWYKDSIEEEKRKIKDLQKILREMDKGKRVYLAVAVGGRVRGAGYILPERGWIQEDLERARDKLQDYKIKLKKVM